MGGSRHTGGSPQAAPLAPLFAAGFTTAFGAHAIAASLGTGESLSLLGLGVVVAIYDVAEVIFKPIFGTWADKVGPRPILLGGLVAFVLASAGGAALASSGVVALAVIRLVQGMAASAFSPAASAMVAALRPTQTGGAFGSYGAWKSLGHALGPILGGVLIWAGGFPALFAALTVLAAVVALWIALSVPHVAPAPKQRQTVLDLARRVTSPAFLAPTLVLAATAGALSVGVGFLPVQGTSAGLSPILTGAVVSLLAISSAVIQPWAGRAYDRGRLTLRSGITVGLGLIALGMVLATAPVPVALIAGAIGIGLGVGIATPVGFTAVAAAAPTGRLGQTMGAAELGRETGDAAGPLLVGAVAAAASLAAGLATFAVLTVVIAVLAAAAARTRARTEPR